jgi:hypothetical protein
MGSKGARPRKAEHSLHLPKVGTATENERLLHDEQRAVLDQMGVGHASRGVKRVVAVVAVVLVGAAIVGLMAVMVFR